MLDKAASELKTYQWGENSAIPQIDVRGDGVAYIHARRDAKNLPELRKILESKGLATSSDIRNGDDSVLRVSGFSNIDDIILLFENAGAVKGPSTVGTVAPDREGSKFGNLKADSLRASGVLYAIANVLYTIYGYKANDADFKRVGYTWNIADIGLALFAGKNDKLEASSLIKKLKKHFDDNGIEVPHDSAINVETMAKPGGFLEKLYEFVHENVNVIKCLAEATGGAWMLRSGLKGRHSNEAGWKETIAAGAVIVTGWMAALLIKERKYDPEVYDQASFFKKLGMKIQEQPLRLAGVAGLTNNAFNIAAVKKQHDAAKANPTASKDYAWRGAGVATFLVANTLYYMSHKTGGNIQSHSIVDDVYGLSAQVLNRMPEDARDAGIKQAAEFLGQRTEIKETREQVEARLREEITALRHNPWFGTGQARNPQQDLTPAR